ncbi:MAG: M48 family metallopeptidase [Oscillospiraceae bacterium]|nr:M48 family metallopeptidase [Oscillospiraceae bacterium]
MGREYEIRRSGRRTLALELTREGKLLVRAPRFLPAAAIRQFVEAREDWIRAAESRQAERAAAHPEPDEAQKKEYIRRARELLPARTAHFAALMGVSPTRITITSARTRFGSCSAKNALSFSWRLMAYPAEAVDYVVVHELAHIRYHDHSPAFYDFIASVLPDHKARRALLRK